MGHPVSEAKTLEELAAIVGDEPVGILAATVIPTSERIRKLQWAAYQLDDPLAREHRVAQVQKRTLRMSALVGRLAELRLGSNSSAERRERILDLLVETLSFAGQFDYLLGKPLFDESATLEEMVGRRQPTNRDQAIGISVGRLAKVAESLDHLEDLPVRSSITSALDELFLTLVEEVISSGAPSLEEALARRLV